MGLTESQSALARLYTDRVLRERFFDEPLVVGHELGLSQDEAAQLAQISAGQIRAFAGSLIGKRLGEAEKLMPLTRQVLGRSFAEHFRRFAAAPVPGGLLKHHADALAFSTFLVGIYRKARTEPPWLMDVLRYERAWLEAFSPFPLCIIRCFRYPIHTLSSLLIAGADIPRLPDRLTLGLWLRFGRHGVLRHRLLRLF